MKPPKVNTPSEEREKEVKEWIGPCVEDLRKLQEELQATIPLIETALSLAAYITDEGGLLRVRQDWRSYLRSIREMLDMAREFKAKAENAPGYVYSWKAADHYWDDGVMYWPDGERLPLRFPSRWARRHVESHRIWKEAHEHTADHYLTYTDMQRWPIVKETDRFVYVVDPKGRQYRLVPDRLTEDVFHSCGRVFSYSEPGPKYLTQEGVAGRKAALRKAMHQAHPDKGGSHEEFVRARQAYERVR